MVFRQCFRGNRLFILVQNLRLFTAQRNTHIIFDAEFSFYAQQTAFCRRDTDYFRRNTVFDSFRTFFNLLCGQRFVINAYIIHSSFECMSIKQTCAVFVVSAANQHRKRVGVQVHFRKCLLCNQIAVIIHAVNCSVTGQGKMIPVVKLIGSCPCFHPSVVYIIPDFCLNISVIPHTKIKCISRHRCFIPAEYFIQGIGG